MECLTEDFEDGFREHEDERIYTKLQALRFTARDLRSLILVTCCCLNDLCFMVEGFKIEFGSVPNYGVEP